MTVEAAARVAVSRPLPAEEQGRADFYALLARLLHSAPDAELLATLAAASPMDEAEPALAQAWQRLLAASAAMHPEAAVEEYQQLFEGMGSSEVSIYAGFYNGALAIDHPRVRIQHDLAALGLARDERVTEPEDHWAGLLDAMRVLVAGGAGRGPAKVSEQRRFFEAHVAPGIEAFFRAVQQAPGANYYRYVGALGLAFMAIEIESFRLD